MTAHYCCSAGRWLSLADGLLRELGLGPTNHSLDRKRIWCWHVQPWNWEFVFEGMQQTLVAGTPVHVEQHEVKLPDAFHGVWSRITILGHSDNPDLHLGSILLHVSRQKRPWLNWYLNFRVNFKGLLSDDFLVHVPTQDREIDSKALNTTNKMTVPFAGAITGPFKPCFCWTRSRRKTPWRGNSRKKRNKCSAKDVRI